MNNKITGLFNIKDNYFDSEQKYRNMTSTNGDADSFKSERTESTEVKNQLLFSDQQIDTRPLPLPN